MWYSRENFSWSSVCYPPVMLRGLLMWGWRGGLWGRVLSYRNTEIFCQRHSMTERLPPSSYDPDLDLVDSLDAACFQWRRRDDRRPQHHWPSVSGVQSRLYVVRCFLDAGGPRGWRQTGRRRTSTAQWRWQTTTKRRGLIDRSSPEYVRYVLHLTVRR